MADQTSLIAWILESQGRLNLRVRNCAWIALVMPGWSDIDLTITLDGRQFSGRGSDPDANTALAKAFCEAVERSVCASYGIHSLGVAGHLSIEEANLNAKREYVERRALSFHFQNGLRLREMVDRSPALQRYRERGIAIDFFLLEESGEGVVFLCLANGLEFKIKFGGILGLGAAETRIQAAEKAQIECLRNLEAILENPLPPLSENQFALLSSPNAFDRMALLFSEEYFRKFRLRFHKADRLLMPELRGEFEVLALRSPALAGCPLKFARFSEQVESVKMHLEFLG